MKIDLNTVLRLAEENDMGLCTSCGEEAYNVEADAINYECESCGKNKVYGMEYLLLNAD